MSKSTLPAIFATEFAQPEVEISSNQDIRDLFGLPAAIRFQGFATTSEYQLYIDEVFTNFTHWLDEQLSSSQPGQGQLIMLEKLRFAVDEYLRGFTWNLEKQTGLNLLDNKRVDMGSLHADDIIYVRAVVSGFLEIQQRTLERVVRFLDLRMRLLRAEKNEGKDDMQMTLVNTLAGLVHNMQPKTQATEVNQKKIVWDGSAQDFVFHFSRLIQSRKIYLQSKHKSDTDPIAVLLHQLFYIPKSKGEGEVSQSTLRTYFKEYSAAGY